MFFLFVLYFDNRERGIVIYKINYYIKNNKNKIEGDIKNEKIKNMFIVVLIFIGLLMISTNVQVV